ncbi:8536_t:CDS:2 [Ambispora gerdemannii]|uniref:8536_t:CDS:1 n=1 Tax=Ambispora gerdemannii TaxID=144530 RepID=A0A9N9A5S0_9GLOM|nr:8536_t:CDS:2 [Ambispora gerdemannii]
MKSNIDRNGQYSSYNFRINQLQSRTSFLSKKIRIQTTERKLLYKPPYDLTLTIEESTKPAKNRNKPPQPQKNWIISYAHEFTSSNNTNRWVAVLNVSNNNHL